MAIKISMSLYVRKFGMKPGGGLLVFILMLYASVSIADPGSYSQKTDVVLIANPTVRQRTITRGLAVAIFSLDVANWPDKTPIRVIVLPHQDPIHQHSVSQIFHIQPYQLDQRWERLFYNGTRIPPRTVADVQTMIEAVKSTPGAIGYAPRSAVDGSGLAMEVAP